MDARSDQRELRGKPTIIGTSSSGLLSMSLSTPLSNAAHPIDAIVPAAGVGLRAGSVIPKQYVSLGDRMVIEHAVTGLLSDPRISRITVAVSPGDTRAREAFAGVQRVQVLETGGERRDLTVLQTLKALALAADHWVLVHDAARPGLSKALLSRFIDAVLEDPVGGLMALPVPDTVKRSASGTVRVEATVDRAELWLAQTPQMFRAGLLGYALQSAQEAGVSVTDESSAIESLGLAPQLVRGDLCLSKITWPEDSPRMASLLNLRVSP